jgi:hypothetical protein
MISRSIIPSSVLAALIMASCIFANPINLPPTMTMPKCEKDPATTLGGPAYTRTWHGARGINSWTSGTNGNNALFVPTDHAFQLESGSATAEINAFHIKITSPGVKDYNYGFLSYKGRPTCIAVLPEDIFGSDTEIKVWTKPWGQ